MTASRPTLLMTRPEVASERFVASLDPKLTERVRVVTAPLIRVVHRDIALDLSGIAGVIFTSANGVHAASTATDRRDLSAFCVGPATTRAAAHAGWEARQVGQDAESLINGLLAARPDGPLLHIRGARARGDVAEVLTKQGLTCGETVLYDQIAQPLSREAQTALKGSDAVIVPLFSPRTAALFQAQAPARPVTVAAISPAVAQALNGPADWDIQIAEAPDAQAMRALVEKLLQSALPG